MPQVAVPNRKPVFSYIALGSNLSTRFGNPQNNVDSAISELSSRGFNLSAKSRLYQTPCFPAGAGPDYVNAVAEIRATVSPQELLDVLHDIEAVFGRKREQRWGSRTLDLDLLDYGGRVLPTAETARHWMLLGAKAQRHHAPNQLILPHPRLHERAFVLVPLAEIAPNWRHPLLGKTATQILEALPAEDQAEIIPI